MIAKVIIDVKQESLDETFDYHIPIELSEYALVGSRVFVEFGARKVLGYIIAITDESSFTGSLKPILEVLDYDVNLNTEQVELAKYLYNTTNSMYATCLEIMLPAFLKGRYRKYLTIHNFTQLDATLAEIIKGRSKVTINEEILANWSKVQSAIKKGLISVDYGFSIYGSRRKTRFYTPTRYAFEVDLNTLTPKRADCVAYVLREEKVTIEDIISNVGCSEYLVNALVKDNLLAISEENVVDDIGRNIIAPLNIEYSFQEQEVITRFNSLSHRKPFLLMTNDEVFHNNFLIDQMIATINAKKQVLILTSSILQNNEYSYLIKRNLPTARVASLNSSLKDADYYETYLNIKNDNIDILVTSMSGIFAPVSEIGLIIVLDEGNLNYINRQNPRFDAIEVLKLRSKYHSAKLILSSIAPSINSFYQQYLSKYYLLRHIIDQPRQFSVVNMKDNIIAGGNNIISKQLKYELKRVLDNKQQAMLILNKKSFSSFIRCNICAHIEQCPECKINLSYYQTRNEYRCLYCNYSRQATLVCSNCHNKSLDYLGFGLEQLYNTLKTKFPGSKILLVDAESVSADFTSILLAIEEGEVDFIIGTSILSNSFYQHNISLVSIIDFDALLNNDDYRANEMAYLMLQELANRPKTKALIQTHNPDNELLRSAIIGDYDQFYEKEIKVRELLNYAPLINISRLIIVGEFKVMYHYANYFKKVFRFQNKGKSTVLGPVYLPRYRGVQLVIKAEEQEKVVKLIKDVSKKFSKENLNIIYEERPRSFN